MRYLLPLCLVFSAFAQQAQQPPIYDLILAGGHVIDPKNGIDGPRDVAIANGKIAKIAAAIPSNQAKATADVTGLYVVPGLIDIHVHVYTGTGLKALTGDQSVYPDSYSFRTGVTTFVDAGTAGWKNFPDFRQRIIDRAKTRVLALINIVDNGMSPTGENDPATMIGEEAAKVAKANADVVVGFKTAHYSGPGWAAVDGLVKAGSLANLPVMVDFGYVQGDRNLQNLLGTKLRAGDLYTHCYSGHREELLNGKINPAFVEGRRRGVVFDVGHGGGSFYWNIATPLTEQGFWPDTISTDLHTGSMNAGMKDMPTTMSKMLALGMPLSKVIEASTWKPAQVIKRPELGHLSVGADADVTVLALEKGEFGLIDSAGARRNANRRLTPEVTVRAGKVVWDLNGRASRDWRQFSYEKRAARP